MKTILIQLILPLSLFFNSWAQVTPGLYILTPVEGQVVSGTVEVKGSLPEDDFLYAELSYAFSDGQSSNWFLIKRIDQVVHDELLSYWDTTTITDGVYRLRLSVHQKNNLVHEVILEDIRVGNYTHYETDTPAAPLTVDETQTSTETVITPTLAQSPLPTTLPENPGSIDQADFKFSLVSGLVLAVLVLGALGVYVYFRQAARK